MILTSSFLLGFITIICDARVLSPPVLNPQCPDTELCSTYNISKDDTQSKNNLVYFESTGTNDTLHYFISFIGGFSILMLQTDLKSQVNVDWTNYLAGTLPSPKISVDGSVYNSLGVTLTRLYRYYDQNDTAKISQIQKPDDIYPVPFSNLFWNNASATSTDESVMLTTSNKTEDVDYLGVDGLLQFTYQVFNSNGRYSKLPHLSHTDTSSQLELLMSNLMLINNNVTNTRYALETVVVRSKSGGSSSDDISISQQRSIDDEYTPGTFDTCHISMDNGNGHNSYILWKPVCYTDGARTLQSSTSVTYTTPVTVENVGGLIGEFYGQGNYVAKAFNVSFGITGDSFYKGYLVWTLEIGAGSVPVEKFSALVIALLVVCASVPGLGLIGGGSYGIYSKFIKKKPSITTTNDEKDEAIIVANSETDQENKDTYENNKF